MKDTKRFVGVDLGAGSGRVMLGSLEAGKLQLEEVHRFPNDPVKIAGTLYWDFVRLCAETHKGIALAAQKSGGVIDGIGVDTWGVDFGLLDRKGGLLGSPVHYRDARTDGMMEEVFQRIPRDEVFEETGIQFMALNTIFQLESVRLRTPDVLRSASKILLTADLVHYFLTGRAVAEFTLATTSQLWNPRKHGWSERIVRALDLPIEIFPEVVYPGSVIGPLREDLAREAQVKGTPPVLATTCHDTASAIAAVPAEAGSSWAYLSSGTWSLLGVELESPRIGRQALERNFTNEGGIAGTTRLLKNIIGLWLVQQCRKQWALDGQDADYAELTRMADASGPAKSFIDPADPSFFAPSDMPAAIRDFCTRTGQAVPATRGEVVRTALESLALAYREVLEYATDLSGKKVDVLHIVGGGSQNRLLNQLAADCLGIPVLTGPVEATALGNVLVQAMGAGLISSVSELRAVARRSTEMVEYSPRDRARWDGAYEIYRKLIARRAN